jgi:hypothetical protein
VHPTFLPKLWNQELVRASSLPNSAACRGHKPPSSVYWHDLCSRALVRRVLCCIPEFRAFHESVRELSRNRGVMAPTRAKNSDSEVHSMSAKSFVTACLLAEVLLAGCGTEEPEAENGSTTASVVTLSGCSAIAPGGGRTFLSADAEKSLQAEWVRAIGRPVTPPPNGPADYVWSGPYGRYLATALAQKNAAVLYDTHGFLGPILQTARLCHGSSTASIDYVLIIDELATLFSKVAAAGLAPHHYRNFQEFPNAAGGADPLNREVQLSSVEFLALAAQTVSAITDLPVQRQTPRMRSFAYSFARIIGYDHIYRWNQVPTKAFSTQASSPLACPGDTDSHTTLGKHLVWKLQRDCRAFTDRLLLTGIAATALLAAHAKSPALVPLSAPVVAVLRDVALAVGIALKPSTTSIRASLFGTAAASYRGRAQLSTAPLLPGQTIRSPTTQFDAIGFDRYQEHWYSNYIGATFPTATQKNPAKGSGLDLGHGRRVGQALLVYLRDQAAAGLPVNLVTSTDANTLANRFALAVFLRSTCAAPLFRNYMSAYNGWYKTNALQKTGYAPFGLGQSALLGGYLQLAPYSDHLPFIAGALLARTDSQQASIDYRKQYLYHGYSTTPLAGRQDFMTAQGWVWDLKRAGMYSSMLGVAAQPTAAARSAAQSACSAHFL